MKTRLFLTALIAILLAGLGTMVAPAPQAHAQGPAPALTAEQRAKVVCALLDAFNASIPNCEAVIVSAIKGVVPTDPKPPVVVPPTPSNNSTTPPANWREDPSLFKKGADEDTLFPKVPKTRRQFQFTWFHARPSPGPSIGSCYMRVGDDEKVIAKGGQRTFYYTGKPDAANRVPVAELQNLVKWWLAVLENPKWDPGYCSEVSGRYIVTYQWSWMAVGTDPMTGRPQ